MITQRAVLFGFVGFCFYLIAIVNALPPFYYSLTWLTAGILVSCFGVALLSLFALQCQWSVPGSVISEWLGHDSAKASGTGNNGLLELDELAGAPGIEIDIANAGTLHKTDIVLEVCLREVRHDEIIMRRFLIEALPSGGHLRTRLPLHDLPRGRYRVQEMRLIGSDVLGLFRLRKRVPNKNFSASSASSDIDENEANDVGHDIVVGPAMIVSPEARAGLQLGGAGGGLDATATLGQGDEVRGTRPYHAGDDLRFVHWKTTARRGELVVREFHRTARNQCVVVWDGSADAASPSRAANEQPRTATAGDSSERFAHVARALNRFHLRRSQKPGSKIEAPVEFGLRITASLCRAIIESGQPCALLRLDSNPLLIPAAEHGGVSSSILSRVSEALADAEADRVTPLTQALSSWLHGMAPGSGLYLITSSPSPELVAAIQTLRSQRSNVTVCVIDSGALAAFEDSGVAKSRSSQSTLMRDQSRAAETAQGIEALRAHGISLIVAPNSPTHHEEKNPGAAHSSETRSDLEVAAIRTALRELLHGTSIHSTSMHSTSMHSTSMHSTSMQGTAAAPLAGGLGNVSRANGHDADARIYDAR